MERKHKCKYCDRMITTKRDMCQYCTEKLPFVRTLLRMVKTAVEERDSNRDEL